MRLALAVASFLFLAGATATGCAGSLQLPPRTDDPGIASLISRRLTTDQRLCPYDITVIVSNRTARLEGKVSSDADRQHAEKIARDAGATRVEDLLLTDPSAGDAAKC